MRVRVMLALVFFLGLTLLLFFVYKGAGVTQEPKDLIRITPTEFFTGELKRLEHHVDFQGYCFKIMQKGSLSLYSEIELWCDGEEIRRGGYAYSNDFGSEELSLSYRQLLGKDERRKFQVKTGGIKNDGRFMDEPKSKQLNGVEFGPAAIRKPIELMSDRESVVIWARGAGRGFDLDNSKDVEKKLRAAPWAIVLRVTAWKEK